MKECIEIGLKTTGTIPGSLQLQRKAGHLFSQKHFDETSETKENRITCSYAFVVAEQNASAGNVVTAPTCGSSGIMPSVLLYTQNKRGFSDEDIVRALAVGGLIQRISHCKNRLIDFINGDLSVIEELEEPVLDESCNGANKG